MKVRDLDNNVLIWKLVGHIVDGGNDRSARSGLHLEARHILKERFPTMTVLEEVPITLRRSQTVFLDFFVPLRKIAVEVQGEQHFKYVPFFHHSVANFIKAKKLDAEKKEWCEINGITLLEFPYIESFEQWKQKLL